uniref:Uncharacterized protein n=1 Tax=Amphimedon queenslandica TaxID=400682 RepID=A0A1X7U0K3_AMPQE
DSSDSNNEGDTALIVAARKGNCDVVELLLKKGADPSHSNDYGYTALIVAAEGGHYDIVQLLLNNGADLSTADNLGDTALVAAARVGHDEIVQLLSEEADPNTSVHTPILCDTETVSGQRGDTALIAVAREGNCDVVELLLKKGVDPNSYSYGNNALIVAAEEGHYDIVQLLLKNGANRSTQNIFSRETALAVAASKGYDNIVQLLSQEPPDQNITTHMASPYFFTKKDFPRKHFNLSATFLNKLLFYPDSPAGDLVFVNIESLINILRDLLVFVCDAHSEAKLLLPDQKALVCKGHLSIEILKKASKSCNKISEAFSDFDAKLLGLFEYLLIATKLPEKESFFMPALLPIKDVSDINPYPNTTPLLFYFENASPMGLFCAVIVHLLSEKKASWKVIEESNFSNYFTLQCRDLLESIIVLVEQVNCIALYCESEDDYIPAREAVEEAVDAAMLAHKLRKRRHDELQHLPDVLESNIAYQVLVESTEEIKEYFSDDFSEIASKLLQMNLITERERSVITDTNIGQNKYQRMEKLMEHVKVAVKIKESVFFLFLNIFNEKGTQPAMEFARTLMERYKDKLSDAHLESLSKRAKQYERD